MNSSVINILRCPVCRSAMETTDQKVCRCLGSRTHCFDFAKSGYINLGGPQTGEGDLKDAVIARRTFLDAGYYQMLSDKLNTLLDEIPSKTLLDAGCGEGYYTNRMAKNRDVLGIDLSRAGVDYAARRAKQMPSDAAFCVASIFSLPVLDSSVDVVTNLFAPCSEEEFTRVLKPGGYVVLVGAGERHLMGLKQVLYDDPYSNPGRADLPKHMELIQALHLRSEITVEGREQIQCLFSMTPYYWRTSPKDRAKLESVENLTTEVDFDIFLFRKGL